MQHLLKIIAIIFLFSIFNANSSLAKETIDISILNKVKVCKDVSCENPGIIDFNKTSDIPLSLDKENNIIGKVWGNELGWITFNPPYGGVFIADTKIGLLNGTAWSETSGAINFAVTGQKVIIDPSSGKWNGYAWASGPYGGWIKFDCKEDSCLKTNLQKKEEIITTLPQKTETKEIIVKEKIDFIEIFNSTGMIFAELFNDFYFSFENLYDGLKFLTKNTSEIMSNSFANLNNGMIFLIKSTKEMITQSFSNLNNGTIFLVKNTREMVSESFSNLNASIITGYDLLYKYSIETRNSVFK